MITVQIIPIIEDNYAYLIQSEDGTTAILDAGEASPIIDVLEERGLTPDYILTTHHHWDHVNGNSKIKAKYNAKIAAPEKEAPLIKGGVDITLKDGDIFTLGQDKAQIIETAGHTMGGICFYFKESGIIFTGDSVFSLGCGRLFEGTPTDMYTSFQKIMALPDETLIYCGHEYTKGNAGFCLANDRDNADLKHRIEEIKDLRMRGLPTIPVTLGMEKRTNIFMKAKSAEEFAALRHKKDNF